MIAISGSSQFGNKKHCPNCNKDVPVFYQETSTMPQDEKNLVRKYKDTLCSVCGSTIEHHHIDEVIQ